MLEGSMEELSLPALFDYANSVHSMATNSSLDQDTLKKGIESLRLCDERINKLGLISANESKEDISTTNLKYLLVPFFLGELIEKVAQDDRIQVIKASQDQLKEFISFCEALDLIPKEEIETHTQEGAENFAAKRAKKIARFQRQKAAEAKLQEIKERRERRHRSLRAAAPSSLTESADEELLEEEGEEEREAWLTTISLALCKAFDIIEMLKKEEEMLLAVQEKQSQDGGKEFAREILDERAKRAEDWHRNAANRATFLKPVQPITCATFAQDVIEGRAKVSEALEHKHQPLIFGPASLVGGKHLSERERMAAQVFQPGHRLPTMSIEEAGLREMEMMQRWQERNAKLVEDANSSWHRDGPRSASDGEEAAEEKARAWDDWKDDNPRGAGNKKLTPCG